MELKIGLPTQKRPYRVMWYGNGGVGKTCAASHAGESGVLINLNDGVRQGDKFASPIDLLPQDGVIPNLATLLKAIDLVKESDKQTVIIDSATEIDDWLGDNVVAEWNKENRNKVSHPDQIDYGKGGIMMAAQWTRFINNVIIPINRAGKNVIILAHRKNVNIKEPTQTESYVKIAPNINNKAIETVIAHLDGVFLFTQDVYVKTNANKMKTGTGGERVIYSSDTPGWYAKCRAFKMPDKMPLDAKKLFEILED